MKSEIAIAHEALDIGRRHMILGSQKVYTKSDRDLVSDTDFAIEREIRALLSEKTPQFGFLGEEEGWADSINEGTFWVLDPVDGTSNFVRGQPLCGVSLALVDNGRIIVGGIDLPFFKERYTAAENEGAYKGERRISANSTDKLEDAIVSIGDYAVGEDAALRNKPRLAITSELAAHVHRVRMLGSAAIDLSWVADGRLDACIMLSNKPWDTAAGVLIAREAGAMLIDTAGDYHTTESKSTVAVTPSLSDSLVDLLNQSMVF